MNWNGRRCWVTGAGGFIGSVLCRELERCGADVHRSGRRVPAGDQSDRWHVCDVSDPAQVQKAFERVRPEFVFHLASTVTGSRDRDVVWPTLRDNLVGTVNVLQAAAEAGGPSVVYMASLQEPDEVIRGVPSSPYAAAKYAASAYVRMFAALYSLPVKVARPFMVYGPGQLDFTKLVPYVLSQLLRGEAARLSSGTQSFDWVYVDDVVEALLALASSGTRGMTIDIGRGELTTMRAVVEGLATRVDRTDLLQFNAMPDRLGEPIRKADVDRTFEAIGWRARVSLEAGLDRTVQWHREFHKRSR